MKSQKQARLLIFLFLINTILFPCTNTNCEPTTIKLNDQTKIERGSVVMKVPDKHCHVDTNGKKFTTFIDGSCIINCPPSIATFSVGDFVVMWQQSSEDSSLKEYYFQVYNGDTFEKITEQSFVKEEPSHFQLTHDAKILRDNTFVVIYSGSMTNDNNTEFGVYVAAYEYQEDQQRTIETKTVFEKLDEFPNNLALTVLSQERFVIVWEISGDNVYKNGIFGQIYDQSLNKESSNFQLTNKNQLSQINPKIVSFQDSQNFVLVYQTKYQDGSGWGIFGQIFNSNAEAVVDEFQVNTYYQENQENPSLSIVNENLFTVVWQGYNKEDLTLNNKIYGQIFNNQGDKIGNEFSVNDNKLNPSNGDDQNNPKIASVENGDFIVIWENYFSANSNWGVLGQMFNSDGEKRGDQFRINDQFSTLPQIANMNNFEDSSNYIIIWENCTSEMPYERVLNGQYFDSILNYIPVINKNLTNQFMGTNQYFEYQFDTDSFVDPDQQDILNYESKLVNGDNLPDWLDFNPNNQTFSGFISKDVCNQYLEIEVVAKDQCNSTVSNNFTLEIINQNPIINKNLINQLTNTNQYFEYQFDLDSFVDPDQQDILNYESKLVNGDNLPDWLDFNPNNQTFSGFISKDVCNQYLEIEVVAKDQCNNMVSNNFTLEIINQNPIINKNLISQLTDTNKYFEYQFDFDSFVDPDQQDILNYESKLVNGDSLPDWLNFNPNNRTFSGFITKDYCNKYLDIEVVAKDQCNNMVSNNFTLEIINQNPIINKNLINQVTKKNQYFEYQFDLDSFVDPDDSILTYESTLVNGDSLPDWLKFNENNRTFSGFIPNDLCLQNLQIEIKAKDQCKNMVSNDFTLQILNQNPIINKKIPNQLTNTNQYFEYQFDFDSFVDPDNSILTYESTLVNGDNLPDWLKFNENLRTFSGFIPVGLCNRTLEIKIIAKNPCKNLNSTNFSLQITNQKPYIQKKLTNQFANTEKYFEYKFDFDSFIDHENVKLSYEAKLVNDESLPGWLIFNPDSHTFSGVAPMLYNDIVVYDIKLIVFDDCLDNNISTTFSITIKADKVIKDPETDHTTTIVAIVASSIILLVVSVVLYFKCIRKKKKPKTDTEDITLVSASNSQEENDGIFLRVDTYNKANETQKKQLQSDYSSQSQLESSSHNISDI
ncbi:hypothetical protein M0812_08394 [Anaeramoeba flamelloides]|uniref:Dystroglycan-type cadherin-like domain-containing protein n=1 Tax=Anaeramoeba flamelloides TaxID=1746091 RepID=A0AAV8A1G7_9EUKA|nr:hypothetical protein M0812_08394 [Anaeramoeba flamelloides]